MEKLFFVVFLIFISCTAPKEDRDPVRQNIESVIMESINDPDSYEFVSLDLVDSTIFADNIAYRRDYFKQQKDDPKNSRILSGIDSLENLMGEKAQDVAAYRYLFTCRANNALGAKVINTFHVQTGPAPAYEVINITQDEDRIILNPNEFPGYFDMASKIIRE